MEEEEKEKEEIARQMEERRKNEAENKEATQKLYASKASYALKRIKMASSHKESELNKEKEKKVKKHHEWILDLTITQCSLARALAPHRKIIFVVSVGASVYEGVRVVNVGDEAWFPEQPIVFNETVSMAVKFRKKRRKGEHQSALLTVLSISIFASPLDHEQWSAEDLVGMWRCGQAPTDTVLKTPDAPAVSAFWKSIEGQLEEKHVKMFGSDKNESGTLEFKAHLKERNPELQKDDKTATHHGHHHFLLSDENKSRMNKESERDDLSKKRENVSVERMSSGQYFTKYSFLPDPEPQGVNVFYVKPDNDAPLGSIYWCEPGKTEESANRRLPIHAITDLYVGPIKGPLPVEDADPEKCLTLVSHAGKLYLEAESIEQVEDWLYGIQSIFKLSGAKVEED